MRTTLVFLILILLALLVSKAFAPVIVAHGPARFSVPSGGGGIAYISSGGASSSVTTDTVTSPPIDTTGANFLVVGAQGYGTTASITVTDNKGNTWNPLTFSSWSGGAATKIWWCKPTTVGTGHTATSTCLASNYPAICFAAFSGVHAVPFDTENGGSAGGANPLLAGSVTPAMANSLLITTLCGQTNITTLIDSGFTVIVDQFYVAGWAMAGAMAYKIQVGGPSAENPAWTDYGGAKAAAIAVFKPL